MMTKLDVAHKMMTKLAVAVLMFIPLTEGVEDCVIQSGVGNAFRLHAEDMHSCYYVSSETLTLSEAVGLCENQLGCHIAFIETETENKLLESCGISQVWLGAVNVNDNWYWKRWQDSTLKPMTFTDWNDADSGFTAAVFGIVHSRWGQVNASGSYKTLCERDDVGISGRTVASSQSSTSHDEIFMSYRPVSLQCTPDTSTQLSASLCARSCANQDNCIAACYSVASLACCMVTSPDSTASPAVNVAEFHCYMAA